MWQKLIQTNKKKGEEVYTVNINLFEDMGAQNGIIFGTIVMNGLLYDSYVISSMTPCHDFPFFPFTCQEDLPTYWVDMCSGDHAKGMTLEDKLEFGSLINDHWKPWTDMFFKLKQRNPEEIIALSRTFCEIRMFHPRGHEPHQESGAQHWLQWLPHLAGDAGQRLWWGSCRRFSLSTELMFLRFRSIQLPNTTNQI